MKARFVLIAIAAVLFAAAGSAHARIAGREASKDFMVTGFEDVSITGPLSVTIVTGKAPSVVARGDRNMIDRLLVRKNGDTLRLSLRRTNTEIDPEKRGGGPLRIEISSWKLASLDVSGPADVRADTLDSQNVGVNLSGAGSIEIGSVMSDKLQINMLGNGSISIAGGRSDLADVRLNGASRLDAPDLSADRLRLSTVGPATVSMEVRRNASITSSGAGSIDIGGSPVCELQSAGLADIRCGVF